MDRFDLILSEPVIRFGASALTLGQLLFLGAGALIVLFGFLVFALWRSASQRHAGEQEAAERSRQADARMAAILQVQAEMQGRLGAVADVFGARQAELTQSINQRLDAMTGRIGQTMTEQTKSTHESLTRLQERLAVIDSAQNNIQSLAGQVVQLQAILSNKQTRGAFGQARMEAIVADGLPQGGYEFQATLSNANRPDCLIRMPNDLPSLVIDAKFPLESWNAIRGAEAPEESARAAQMFRRDMEIHIRAISEKYLIPGETQETAFLFVPSESIFAEIHENFEVIVQKAHRARVVIVSPSLLMLSVQVVQAILKDARMREQAHLIRDEVVRLLEDVSRLDERIRKLHGHFTLTARDIDQIVTSTEKVSRRGQRIRDMELGEENSASPAVARPAPATAEPPSVSAKSGQLRLRVVDEGN